MTNADEIRSTADEESSEFICCSANCKTCEVSKYAGCCLDEWLEAASDDKESEHK